MNGGFGDQIRSIVILPLYPQKIENSHTCVNSPCNEGKCCRERYKQSADAVANAIQVLQDYYAQGAFAQVSDSHWHCWETPRAALGGPLNRQFLGKHLASPRHQSGKIHDNNFGNLAKKG